MVLMRVDAAVPFRDGYAPFVVVYCRYRSSKFSVVRTVEHTLVYKRMFYLIIVPTGCLSLVTTLITACDARARAGSL